MPGPEDAENAVAEEAKAFAEAFLPEGDDAEVIDEETLEEETPPEAEETGEENLEPGDAGEANRSSLLGRIQASRKGLPKMEASYQELYGTIPGDPTEDEIAEHRTAAEASEHVAEELPEVAQAIAHQVAEATGKVREELTREAEVKAQESHIAALEHAHPDIVEFQTKGSPEQSLLSEWVDAHSHQEAKALEKVLADGSTAQVIGLLDEFKEQVEQILQKSPSDSVRDAAEAVPAGMESTLIGAPIVETDDFSGAFKAALAEE